MGSDLFRLLIALALLPTLSASGATIDAASTSWAHVSNAVFSAAPSGDTVNIPAGSSAWNGPIVYEKSLTVRGAGKLLTEITDNFAGSPALIQIHGPTNQWNVWSDLTIVMGTTYSAFGVIPYVSGAAILTTGTPTWAWFTRIDIDQMNTRGISTQFEVFGLINYCTITSPLGGTGISPDDGDGRFSSNRWNTSWSTAVGSTNTLVIEYNTFDWETTQANGAVDAYGGQHYCFRYNRLINANVGNHGTDSSGLNRSALGAEVYGNTNFVTAIASGYLPYSFRGGAFIIRDNKTIIQFGASHATGIKISTYRSTGINVYPEAAPIGCCAPFGPTTFTNRWSGNSNAFGWPTMDGIGRTGPSTYYSDHVAQSYFPSYMWGNTVDGVDANAGVVDPDDANTGIYSHISRPSVLIQKDRDWFEMAMPGYVPLVTPHPLTTTEPVTAGIAANCGPGSRAPFRP